MQVTWSSLEAELAMSSARQDWRLDSLRPDRLIAALLLVLGDTPSDPADAAGIISTFVGSGTAHRSQSIILGPEALANLGSVILVRASFVFAKCFVYT